MARQTIAIIGYGDFSKLMIRHLGKYFNVLVASRRTITNKQGMDFVQADLATALAQTTIIPSIPAQALGQFLHENKRLINPEALVVDVCSVKVRPVEAMRKELPKTCKILATHPLFGPESAKNGLSGQKIMLHPVRLPKETYRKAKEFLHGECGLQVLEMTPEEHDKMMAYAQGLSHYIGRVMQNMRIPETPLATRAYGDLLDMKRIQGSDSWDLFESIMFENPYAADVMKRFKKAMLKLDTRLGIEYTSSDGRD